MGLSANQNAGISSDRRNLGLNLVMAVLPVVESIAVRTEFKWAGSQFKSLSLMRPIALTGAGSLRVQATFLFIRTAACHRLGR
jgi:hypothetical protein